MTEMIRNPHVQTLFILAQQDEMTLRFPLPDQIYGFHAQQSCEKLLKALISSNKRTYPFTHSLEKLADILIDCGEVLPVTSFDLLTLGPFAVQLRYDISGQLTESDRISIRESVAVWRQHITIAFLLSKRKRPGARPFPPLGKGGTFPLLGKDSKQISQLLHKPTPSPSNPDLYSAQ